MDDVRFPPHPTLAGSALPLGDIARRAGAAQVGLAEASRIETPIDMTERFRTLGNAAAFLRGPVLRAAAVPSNRHMP